ncbi:hypothetical protein LMTR13_23990 [Bradyrhizobium icense]|uniref:Uncharacterized protein n=1 Tax=Bradyrhizobium icense TaxID=1274631 RepID=A0A1B1UJ35_9BRAD|nr:hypothetical protein LMTR13_23990 [Bradyrhizobium icense]
MFAPFSKRCSTIRAFSRLSIVAALLPAPPGDHLDATIGINFLPSIMHRVCHRFTSTDQLSLGWTAGEKDKEVRGSWRLDLVTC